MNSNSTPFKKRNNPFSTGGTSIFDETPEPAPKVEEKPKQVVQEQKVVVSDDNNKIKHYDEILTRFSHDFQFASDEQMFFDVMNVDFPSIIILDATSNSIDLPHLYRKINSIKENVVTTEIYTHLANNFIKENYNEYFNRSTKDGGNNV